MEITNEIKAKVFAQYLGQRTVELYLLEPFALHDIINGKIKGQIVLKPLSAITDEEAIEAAKIFGLVMAKIIKREKSFLKLIDDSYSVFIRFNGGIEVRKYESAFYESKIYLAYQFLQSRGYDLPNYYLNGKTLKEAGLAIYE